MDAQLVKQTILVVDDVPENIDILNQILQADYRVKAARNGWKALKIAASLEEPPDLILLDIMMPGMDGYEVCQLLKSDLNTRHIPIIFVTTQSETEFELKGFELGAVDYLTKPINPAVVKARVKTHLALYDQNRALEDKVRQRTTELDCTRLEIIRRLGRAAEFKDFETGMHVLRVSWYTKIIGMAHGLRQDYAELIYTVAPMHDVGKIGIPDKILLKPGKLDPQEWEIMKQHTTIGAEIIGEHSSDLLKVARTIALTHHEQWNGRGYPSGLMGVENPIEGRILAIADVFDALTSNRPYKNAWSVQDAVAWIQSEKGERFDPVLVTIFLEHLPEILKVRDQYPEKNSQISTGIE